MSLKEFENLLNIAYELLVATDAEAKIIYESLSEDELEIVTRLMDEILQKMEKW